MLIFFVKENVKGGGASAIREGVSLGGKAV